VRGVTDLVGVVEGAQGVARGVALLALVSGQDHPRRAVWDARAGHRLSGVAGGGRRG